MTLETHLAHALPLLVVIQQALALALVTQGRGRRRRKRLVLREEHAAQRGRVVVVLKEVAVDVSEVDKLDVGRVRTEVEGGDFDWADERGAGRAGELSVDEVYEGGG